MRGGRGVGHHNKRARKRQGGLGGVGWYHPIGHLHPPAFGGFVIQLPQNHHVGCVWGVGERKEEEEKKRKGEREGERSNLCRFSHTIVQKHHPRSLPHPPPKTKIKNAKQSKSRKQTHSEARKSRGRPERRRELAKQLLASWWSAPTMLDPRSGAN